MDHKVVVQHVITTNSSSLYVIVTTRIDYDRSGFITLEKVLLAYEQWNMPPEYSHELMIKKLFDHLDIDNDGSLKENELKAALEKENVSVSLSDINKFVSFIDRDYNGIVTYDEWRDFLLLFPINANISFVYDFVYKACMVDIGEEAIIPVGMSFNQMGKYFIAGGIAGASSRTVTAPLDRLKILFQIQSNDNIKYKSVVDGFKVIYRESGITGFWIGNGINIIKIAPESAIKFLTYEKIKHLFCSNPEEMSVKFRFISGGIAGLISQIFVFPLEMLKVRLIAQHCRGAIQTAKNIWKKEGFLSFFQGIRPALLGVIPYSALDLSVFETLMHFYKVRYRKDPNAFTLLSCGTISSFISVTAVYPLSLIKTRLQVQGLIDTPKYSGMVDVIKKTYQAEGFNGFYKGITPNLLKVVPAASISYLVYETCKHKLSLK